MLKTLQKIKVFFSFIGGFVHLFMGFGKLVPPPFRRLFQVHCNYGNLCLFMGIKCRKRDHKKNKNMKRLYCRSLKRTPKWAPSVWPIPERIRKGWARHAFISDARPPCLSVSICWYARTFPKLHGAFSGITLAGNICFKLTGRGWANRAQQLYKGNKKETRVLSPCQWGSLRGDGAGHWMCFFICQKARRAVSMGEWVWLFLKGIFWEGVFVRVDNEQSEE